MNPLEIMRERRAAKKQELDELLSGPTDEKRDLTTDESTTFDFLVEEIRKIDARIDELEQQEAREAAAAEARRVAGESAGHFSPARVTDPVVYAKGNTQRSFWRDLAKSQLFDNSEARDRLNRHAAQQADEKRALGNTNTTGGSGGEFAPPDWMVAEYVALARPGRVTADLFRHMDVPPGKSSVMLPAILTGTTVALQSTQNTALSQTDLTTGSVGTGFSTVGGKQVVAQQLLDQSEIDFDSVVMGDLTAAWGQNIGTQVLTGAGTGSNNNSVVNGLTNASVASGNAITFTSGSPTPALFYSKAAGMLAAFAATRFAEPTVWLMHPRRWYWLLAATDTNQRPLVVPRDIAVNPIGTASNPVGIAGAVGVFLGLPVVLDPLIPTNIGGGTNQDEVFLLKQDDLWLLESPPQAEVFREPYADSVGVLFRLYSYIGTILNRHTASIATMNGTGLIAPTF